jgi:hypothetical protein
MLKTWIPIMEKILRINPMAVFLPETYTSEQHKNKEFGIWHCAIFYAFYSAGHMSHFVNDVGQDSGRK